MSKLELRTESQPHSPTNNHSLPHPMSLALAHLIPQPLLSCRYWAVFSVSGFSSPSMEQAIRKPGFKELEWTLVLGSAHLSLDGVIRLGFPKKGRKRKKTLFLPIC